MKFLKTLGFTMILIALAFLLAAALFWGLSIGTVKLPLLSALLFCHWQSSSYPTLGGGQIP